MTWTPYVFRCLVLSQFSGMVLMMGGKCAASLTVKFYHFGLIPGVRLEPPGSEFVFNKSTQPKSCNKRT